jgi:hypothetical protein
MDVMVRYAKAVYRPWNTIFQKLIVFGPAVTCAVRQQRSGHIINMSSMGGYQVTIVEPSYFRTDFLDDQLLGRTRQRIDHYDATVGAVREVAASRHHAQLGNPAMLGKALPEIVNLPQPPLRPPLASDTVIENKTRSVSQELRFRQRNRMG